MPIASATDTSSDALIVEEEIGKATIYGDRALQEQGCRAGLPPFPGVGTNGARRPRLHLKLDRREHRALLPNNGIPRPVTPRPVDSKVERHR
jgi:hypothetical protein